MAPGHLDRNLQDARTWRYRFFKPNRIADGTGSRVATK